MCWSDKTKSRSIYRQSQTAAAGATVVLPANALRVGLIVSASTTAGDVIVLASSGISTQIANIRTTNPNLYLKIEDVGSVVQEQITILGAGNNGTVGITELLLNKWEE